MMNLHSYSIPSMILAQVVTIFNYLISAILKKHLSKNQVVAIFGCSLDT